MKPVREFPDGVYWGGTTHPNCRQQHSVGWNTRLSKNEKVNNPGIDGSLLPACRYNVTSCLTLLLPCFPCHNLIAVWGGTLKLQAHINPSLPTLFLWYFVKAIWKETDYIVENSSAQLHVVVCAGSINICDHKTDQIDICDSTKSHEEARTIMRKSQCKNYSLFSPCFYWQSIERPPAIALPSFLHIRNRRQALFSLIGVELSYYWTKTLVLPSMGLLISPFVYHQWAS